VVQRNVRLKGAVGFERLLLRHKMFFLAFHTYGLGGSIEVGRDDYYSAVHFPGSVPSLTENENTFHP
jgi:hypothetical protein